MAAGRKNRECAMRSRKCGSNLVSALRESGTRAESDKERDKNRDPGESLTRAQNRHRLTTTYLDAERLANFVLVKILSILPALRVELCSTGQPRAAVPTQAGNYFGRVIAPSDADATNAAYLPNTPVG